MSNTMQSLQQSQFDRAAPILRRSKVMKATESFYMLLQWSKNQNSELKISKLIKTQITRRNFFYPSVRTKARH